MLRLRPSLNGASLCRRGFSRALSATLPTHEDHLHPPADGADSIDLSGTPVGAAVPFRGGAHGETHTVTNQARPLIDTNLYTGDKALVDAVSTYTQCGLQRYLPLENHGALLGSERMVKEGVLANTVLPTLKNYSPYGERLDEVEYHPSYHNFMEVGIDHGATRPRPELEGRGAHVVRASHMYMQNQIEAGHCCPLVMTHAAIPLFKSNVLPDTVAKPWLERLLNGNYDPRNLPIEAKSGVTLGMSMTEKQGGSDVRTNSTVAAPLDPSRRESGDLFALTGHKWFTSAPMSDGFLTLAYTDHGLTCFLVPRWLDGERNAGLQFLRLKEKLGDKSNASSEVEYRAAKGWLVGEEGKGIRTILEMVHHTRLDCAIGSAGGMRRALSVALNHTATRRAFGATLLEQPLMQHVMMDVAVEVEAATWLALRTAATFDAVDAVESANPDEATSEERAFSRLITAAAKYFITKQYPGVAYECMEALGGNGYIEDHAAARLFRQSPLNSIWEGSGNVVALDVLRTLAHPHEGPAAMAGLTREMEAARGMDTRLDAHFASLNGHLSWLQGATSDEQQRSARELVNMIARAVQGSALVRAEGEGSDAVAAAFCATRLGGGDGVPRSQYGCLRSADTDPATRAAILKRAMPQ